MEELSADILVLGSGLAGIVSALEAEKAGHKIILAAKFAIGFGTNTSLSGGGFAAANPQFSKEDHLRATLESGKGLNDNGLVKALVGHGPEMIDLLKGLGVSLVERRIGYGVDRLKDVSRIPGILLISPLIERLRRSSVQLLPGIVIFDLIIEEGEIQGAFGFFIKDGRPCLIHSKAVVLAAGGAGGIYRRNDNQKTILGDGYVLALRAGLPLFNLEFIQFFPFVLAEPGLFTLLLMPPYPKGFRLFDEKGRDPLETLGIQGDVNEAILTQRDRLSVHLVEAGDVYVDLTQVSRETWDRVPYRFLKRSRFPFQERPFLVSPAVHFFMGGVKIDEKGRTEIPGLFAAGEVTWGVHGANRHGGNALTECAVFGVEAGRSATRYIYKGEGGKNRLRVRPESLLKKWEKEAKGYLRRGRGKSDHPRDLLLGLKSLAWRYAGPVREGNGLKEGLELLASIEGRVQRFHPATVKDLFRKREMENMILLTKAILHGSLLRTESRGAFYRKDFPDRDDQNWLRHTGYEFERGEIKITHHPVT